MRADFSGGLLDDSAAIFAGLDGHKCGCKTNRHSDKQTRRASRPNEFAGGDSLESAAADYSKTRAGRAGRDMDFARKLGCGK